MSNNEELMKNIVQPLSVNSSALSRANCHLTFALVKHLIEKDVIDLDEYLESQRTTEEALKEETLLAMAGDDDENTKTYVEYIEMMFEFQRNQLAKL